MITCLSGVFSWRRSKRKPLKIWNSTGTKRIGIVSDSMDELRNKVGQKFKLTQSDFVLVLEEDGTAIEDEDTYRSLPLHTVLLVLIQGEKWQCLSGRDKIQRALQVLTEANHMKDVSDEVYKMIELERDPQRLALLGDMATTTSANIQTETRKQHPEWFEGHTNRFKTKNDVMKENAGRRVRKYLTTASDHIHKHRSHRHDLQHVYDNILRAFKKELRRNDCYGDYFGRCSKNKALRLCDSDGWFRCEGIYNKPGCEEVSHYINPYGSRAAYTFFSTWNLDHGIEKSREVLPRLLDAVLSIPEDRSLNWRYFYALLFTRQNLRLVHTVCHDKTEHSDAKCDPEEFYV